jgi:hypothetical protein
MMMMLMMLGRCGCDEMHDFLLMIRGKEMRSRRTCIDRLEEWSEFALTDASLLSGFVGGGSPSPRHCRRKCVVSAQVGTVHDQVVGACLTICICREQRLRTTEIKRKILQWVSDNEHQRVIPIPMSDVSNPSAVLCVCVRDGREVRLPPNLLVEGDVVHVLPGDFAPADIEVMYVSGQAMAEDALDSLDVGKVLPWSLWEQVTASKEARTESAHGHMPRPFVCRVKSTPAVRHIEDILEKASRCVIVCHGVMMMMMELMTDR